ncbi:related to acetylxylan esterase precursor [Ramularia collo-cygni]|uniref:Related to acetylxylan esterase n=1 Tax=Ramularia collo-cygni TaxID=112498 RepID=A0A2D3UUK6_9PEZI|nr:related to acetylxylan esterase precursor [Ramularia collo-cygni]CZT17775.1 related to acetylxylan esterase precursor [Ramularia collo-cygni]
MQQTASLSLLTLLSALSTTQAVPTTSCPPIHIFGARETTAKPGFGLAGAFITDIIDAFPDATTEAISYPANGNAGLTDSTYKTSVRYGVGNATQQIKAFAGKCPDAMIVLVGYSQGSKVFDDALCGGGDPNMGISSTDPTIAQYNIRAVLLPADDRFTPGEPYHVGNATHGGFDARPSDQIHCGSFDDQIQLYCDAEDKYCSNGSSLKTHNGYHGVYGVQALEFVKGKLKG